MSSIRNVGILASMLGFLLAGRLPAQSEAARMPVFLVALTRKEAQAGPMKMP